MYQMYYYICDYYNEKISIEIYCYLIIMTKDFTREISRGILSLRALWRPRLGAVSWQDDVPRAEWIPVLDV